MVVRTYSIQQTQNNAAFANYSYAYDNNRNIVAKNDNGAGYQFSYDPLNRIKSSSQFNEAYAYDSRNRLTQVTTEDGKAVSYRYNGDNLMVERTEGGVTTRYYYDDRAKIVAEGRVEGNGSVTITAAYVHDSNGKLLVRQVPGQNGLQYYVTNGHGDVTEIRDAQGNVLNRYTYDIWGNPLVQEETVPNIFCYSGEYWDAETNLQYLRARWYDPSVGRFINEDTYEGDIANPLSQNLYTYVENNPLIYVDPTGNYCVSKDGNYAHGGQCSGGGNYLGDDKNLTGLPIINKGILTGYLNLGPTEHRAENYYKTKDRDYYLSLVDRGVREDEVSWFVFETLVGGGLGSLAKKLAKSTVSSAAKNSGTVWDFIKATQPLRTGTSIPKSFELTTANAGKIFVNPNATKHMEEFVTRSFSHGYNMTQQGLMTSFKSAVDYATRKGIVYDKMINVGGWELMFSAAREVGQLPVIKHALLK